MAFKSYITTDLIDRMAYQPSPKQVFTCLQYKSFENKMGKGEISRNFSFSTVFRELSAIFIEFEIVLCKLFQFGRV